MSFEILFHFLKIYNNSIFKILTLNKQSKKRSIEEYRHRKKQKRKKIEDEENITKISGKEEKKPGRQSF